MKAYLLILSALISSVSISKASDSEILLNQSGVEEIDLTINTENSFKSYHLDNPYVYQLSSYIQSNNKLHRNLIEWIELILQKKHREALLAHSKLVFLNDEKSKQLKVTSELYLLLKNGYFQTFLHRYLENLPTLYSAENPFTYALDNSVPLSFFESALQAQAFFLTTTEIKLVNEFKIKAKSNLLMGLDTLIAFQTKKNAAVELSKLSNDHPLKIPLAYMAILETAKEKKLGASGKILKSVIEPYLTKISNLEEKENAITLYFMTLARLLFQANAFEESQKYYKLIPPGSNSYLQAQTESLWASLKTKNFSALKAKSKTLFHLLFDKHFVPEAYVVSLLANIKLCQFLEANNDLRKFQKQGMKWINEINNNLSSDSPRIIQSNFHTEFLSMNRLALQNEMQKLKLNKLSEDYIKLINEAISGTESQIKLEILSQWKNREKLLDSAIYKMKFAKIELISRMRDLAHNINNMKSDQVGTYQASLAKSTKNQISFPSDGMLWGDEVFQLRADVQYKCLDKRN